jgi:hypothetical protein
MYMIFGKRRQNHDNWTKSHASRALVSFFTKISLFGRYPITSTALTVGKQDNTKSPYGVLQCWLN